MKSQNIIKFYLCLIIKIVAYSLPLKYSFRRNFFGRNGLMDDLNYCEKIFNKHVLRTIIDPNLKNILEIGPGDSCFTALFALRNNFDNITLIDKNTNQLISSLIKLEEMGIKIINCFSNEKLKKYIFEENHNSINVFLINEDFKKLPKIEIPMNDIIFSNAVLQHLDKTQLMNVMEFL